MSNIRVACTAIGNRIVAGKPNKAGNMIINKVDVTSDCLKAVIDKIGVGYIEVISENGIPKYEIEVREIKLSVDENGDS